jgi:hypothetical protein
VPRLRGHALLILILLAFLPGGEPVISEGQGLTWCVEQHQLIPYRIVTNLTDPSHNGIVEDMIVFAKVNETPPIPEFIEERSQIPYATGSLYDDAGLDFTPYLAALHYFPAMISDLTFTLAMPAGNWSLIHALYEAYGFYSLSQNDTHYGISLGVIIDSQRTQTRWIYFKENGTMARYARTFLNSTHEAAFSMTQTYFPESTTSDTSSETATQTGGQPPNWLGILTGTVGSISIAALLIVAIYYVRKRRGG